MESRKVVVNVLDCDIVVSEIEPQSNYYVYFWTNTLDKGKNRLKPASSDGINCKIHSSSAVMILTLNNPWRLICH